MYHQSLNSIVVQNQQNASASDIEFYIKIYLYFSPYLPTVCENIRLWTAWKNSSTYSKPWLLKIWPGINQRRQRRKYRSNSPGVFTPQHNKCWGVAYRPICYNANGALAGNMWEIFKLLNGFGSWTREPTYTRYMKNWPSHSCTIFIMIAFECR